MLDVFILLLYLLAIYFDLEGIRILFIKDEENRGLLVLFLIVLSFIPIINLIIFCPISIESEIFSDINFNSKLDKISKKILRIKNSDLED